MTVAPTGRTAVVTGGASGIGQAVAERLAGDGLSVALVDRNGEAAAAAAEKIATSGSRAVGVTADVTDRAAIAAGLAQVREQLGPVTVLVNSAGLDGFDPFLKITPETWDRILAVNLTGTFNMCQLVLPDMVEAGWGRIVNISSSSTHGGQPFMAHYVSAKSAVNGLTKSLALEFGPKGITVNAIPPGFIDTPMLRAAEQKGPARGHRRRARGADPRAPSGTTRGHCGHVRLPGRRRGGIRHRSDHRGQRGTEHLTWLGSPRCLLGSGRRRCARSSPLCDRPTPAMSLRRDAPTGPLV